MNVGFYVDHLSNDDQLLNMFESIGKALSNKTISDAALFFDDASPCKYVPPCGVFNSCDLWSFHGKLLASSLNSWNKAKSIVNNIDMYYYYEIGKINTLSLISLDDTKIICNGVDAQGNFTRITNTRPKGMSNNYENIVEVML